MISHIQILYYSPFKLFRLVLICTFTFFRLIFLMLPMIFCKSKKNTERRSPTESPWLIIFVWTNLMCVFLNSVWFYHGEKKPFSLDYEMTAELNTCSSLLRGLALLLVVKPVAECHPWMPWMLSCILSASRYHVPSARPGNSVPHRTCTLHGPGKKYSQASSSSFFPSFSLPLAPLPCVSHTQQKYPVCCQGKLNHPVWLPP